MSTGSCRVAALARGFIGKPTITALAGAMVMGTSTLLLRAPVAMEWTRLPTGQEDVIQ
jgi:hypothetical protein